MLKSHSKIPQGTEPQLRISQSAVEQINDKNYVFVAGSPNHFQIREVQISNPESDTVKVEAGLSKGEQIVTKGTFVLKSKLLKSQFGDSD